MKETLNFTEFHFEKKKNIYKKFHSTFQKDPLRFILPFKIHFKN